MSEVLSLIPLGLSFFPVILGLSFFLSSLVFLFSCHPWSSDRGSPHFSAVMSRTNVRRFSPLRARMTVLVFSLSSLVFLFFLSSLVFLFSCHPWSSDRGSPHFSAVWYRTNVRRFSPLRARMTILNKTVQE